MREWADILNDWKCGGYDTRPKPPRITVNIGDRYEVYFAGQLEEVKSVTAENKKWFEDAMNDKENDILWFEKI